jgi:hypothetical protein
MLRRTVVMSNTAVAGGVASRFTYNLAVVSSPVAADGYIVGVDTRGQLPGQHRGLQAPMPAAWRSDVRADCAVMIE